MNWGFRIAFVYIAFVAGILTLVIMSTKQKVDLVRDDYYIEELLHQKKIDKENHANDLSAPVAVRSSADGAVIELPKEFHRQQVSGTVYFYRPSDAQLDRRIVLTPDTAGQQIIRTALVTGQYNVQVEWTMNGQSYFSETPLYVQR